MQKNCKTNAHYYLLKGLNLIHALSSYHNCYKTLLIKRKIKSQNASINATFFPTLVTPFLKLCWWVLTRLIGVTCIREGSPTARTQPGGAALSCRRCPGRPLPCPAGAPAGRRMPVGCPRAIRTKKAPSAGHALTPLPSGRISPGLLRADRPEPGPVWPLSAGGLLMLEGCAPHARSKSSRGSPSPQWRRAANCLPGKAGSSLQLPVPPRTVPTLPPHAPPGPSPCAPRAAEPPRARPHGYLPRAWWRRRWASRGCPWGCHSAPAWPPSRGGALWHRGCRCLCRGCPAGRGSRSSAPCSETLLSLAGRSRKSTDLEREKQGALQWPPARTGPRSPGRAPAARLQGGSAPWSRASSGRVRCRPAPAAGAGPAGSERFASPARRQPAAGGGRQCCSPVPIAGKQPTRLPQPGAASLVRPQSWPASGGRGEEAASPDGPAGTAPLARPPRAGQLCSHEVAGCWRGSL